MRSDFPPNRDQLRVIFDNMADGILVQDQGYRCVYANSAGALLCGFDSPQAFQSASLPEVINRFELLTDSGEPFPLEKLPARLALKGEKALPEIIIQSRNKETGRRIWSSVTSRPIFDEHGNPCLAVSIFRDVTAQRKQRAALTFLSEASVIMTSSLDYKETLQRVARVAVPDLADWCSISVMEDDGPRSIVIAHSDPNMVKAAEEFRQKYPPDWNSDTGAAKVLRTGKSELHCRVTDELIAASARDQEHLRLLRILRIRSVLIVPIRGHSGNVGVLTLVSSREDDQFDENDLKIAEEVGRRAGLAIDNARLYAQAQDAIRARDEFFSIASHELKTPITALKLQLQMSQRRKAKGDLSLYQPKSVDKLIDTGARQIDRLSKLVDDMLDISRIAHGKLLLETEEVDLGPLVRDVVDRFEEQLRTAGSKYRIHLESDVTGMWDRYRIEQVVTNLLTNAIKYGAGKPIDVSVFSEGSHAIVRVADHGMGIAEDNLSRIFQRFERAVTAKNIGGLGLGLYISKQIVEAHSGEIRVHSEIGKGSTFFVELPLIRTG